LRYDLKKPCKNCPFAPTETRIRFSCKERAEEIEESAYRHGFPCHLSAEHREGEFDDGFIAGENTQLCMGAAMMYLASGQTSWPGIDNNEEIADKIAGNADWNAPHYDNEDAFIAGAVEPRTRS